MNVSGFCFAKVACQLGCKTVRCHGVQALLTSAHYTVLCVSRHLSLADVARNASVECLRHIPLRFFEGLYDEIAVQGLPINDRVPLAPVPFAVLRDAPSAAPRARAVDALRPLVRSVVVDVAGSVFSYLKQAVVRAVVGPVPLYRT